MNWSAVYLIIASFRVRCIKLEMAWRAALDHRMDQGDFQIVEMLKAFVSLSWVT